MYLIDYYGTLTKPQDSVHAMAWVGAEVSEGWQEGCRDCRLELPHLLPGWERGLTEQKAQHLRHCITKAK